jgi:2-dehydro-3-deoxyphosphogluconate aldolase/(4S)-4-hydroxy-2-oxoglutarate aldolase
LTFFNACETPEDRNMARHSRLVVLNTIIETGLVPVFYHPDVEISAHILQACLDGGARCVEYTNRGEQANRVFEELARRFCDQDGLILGAGTVVDVGTACLYLQSGAEFVVGPVLNPEVARACNRRKVAYIPGCGSVSEISQAEELGVEICKIFPGKEVGGPGFVEAVHGPMPWTRIMPTGGVDATEESIRAWFKAGVAGVGMGSKLITKERMASQDYAGITEAMRQILGWIKAARGGKPALA